MRGVVVCVALSIALLSSAAAQSGWVYRGNDTGGIIPWSPGNELTARDVAAAHCAGYGKYARITSVVRDYGNYIGFNCLWRPDIARFALPAVPLMTDCVAVRKRVHGHARLVNVCQRRLAATAISPLPR